MTGRVVRDPAGGFAGLGNETMADSIALSAPDQVRFTIGRTLALSFGVLGRNIGPMALIGLVVSALQSILDYLITGDPTGDEGGGNSILGLVTYAFITAPVTYATFQDLRGTQLGTAGMLSGGFRRIGRVIGATFALGLILLVPILIVAVMAVALGGASLYVLVPAIGIFAAFILVAWFVLVPTLVVEDIRFFAAFGRAFDLTHGRRWRIFGLLLVYGTIIVAMAVVMLLLMAIAQSVVLMLVVLIPFVAFYSVIGAILPAVVYYLLRAEKEGIGIDDIAKVFD
jgi:hypothetical protein